VLGSRWFSGFATAVVLLSVFAAAGLPWGGVGESTAAQTQGSGPIRVKFPWLPDPDQWIYVESFHWEVLGSPTRPQSGSPTASEMVITKVLDDSSLSLHTALARGEHIPEVTIEVCKQDCSKGIKYMQIVMTDVIITGYNVGGSTENPLPTESISMNYGKIKITYHEQDKKNDPIGTMGWDCTAWPKCVQD
jgi:type VI secretion system secreted protein Hcp